MIIPTLKEQKNQIDEIRRLIYDCFLLVRIERVIEPIPIEEMIQLAMKLMMGTNAIIVKMIPKNTEPRAAIPISPGFNFNQEASCEPTK